MANGTKRAVGWLAARVLPLRAMRSGLARLRLIEREPVGWPEWQGRAGQGSSW